MTGTGSANNYCLDDSSVGGTGDGSSYGEAGIEVKNSDAASIGAAYSTYVLPPGTSVNVGSEYFEYATTPLTTTTGPESCPSLYATSSSGCSESVYRARYPPTHQPPRPGPASRPSGAGQNSADWESQALRFPIVAADGDDLREMTICIRGRRGPEIHGTAKPRPLGRGLALGVQGGGSAPARGWGESPILGTELGAECTGAKLRRTSDGRVYARRFHCCAPGCRMIHEVRAAPSPRWNRAPVDGQQLGRDPPPASRSRAGKAADFA